MNKYSMCIGNNNYQYLDPLSCAINDAEEIGKALEDLGFINFTLTDVDRNCIGQITDFANTIEENSVDVFLVYYAGHGEEIDGENYLLPIDYPIAGSKGNRTRIGYGLSCLIDALSQYENVIKIIILDACRSNSGRGVNGSGFAPIYAPKNTIIAFSTSPAQTAKENTKINHGYYTDVLLRHIKTPFVSIESMFKEVRKELIEVTNGQQVPWEHTSLVKDYFFNRKTLDSTFDYSENALADYCFVFENKESPIKRIVEALKSHDFYIQNDAIDDFYSLTVDDAFSNDELFILGRNILQAAEGNSIRAASFIKNFARINVLETAKIHILNGIAFEMYFDSHNTIRKRYKSKFTDTVIDHLESDIFKESCRFIADSLGAITERVIYIPGQRQRMRVNVKLVKKENIFEISAMFYEGKQIYDINDYEDRDRRRKGRFNSVLSAASMCPSSSMTVEYDESISEDDILEYGYFDNLVF